MLVSDVIKHFGSATEAARKLKLKSSSAVTNWERRYKGRVPELHARRLHEMTHGRLRFDREAYGLDS